MISWRLWLALRRPFIAHPIYQLRGVWHQLPRQDNLPFKRLRAWLAAHQLTLSILLVILAVVLTILYGPAPIMMMIFGLPFVGMFFGLPLFLLGIGTFYGLASAIVTSDSIANERRQGRFALMGLTTYGAAGAAWALCSVEFHRHHWFYIVRETIASVYLMVITFAGFPLFFTFALFLIDLSDPVSQYRFFSLVSWLVIIFTPGLDYVQSANIGCLVGMIAPAFTSGRANARGLASGIFLALQFGTYIVVGLCSFYFWPRLYFELGWEQNFSYYILCVFTLIVCREIVTIVLWFTLAYALDAELDELDAIAQIGIRSLPGIFRSSC